MTAFDVDVDGRILGEMDAQRVVNRWLMRTYRDEVARRDGVGSALLMEFIKACGDSVRIREAVGVSDAKAPSHVPEIVEVSVGDAAPLVGCSPQYLRLMAREGRVPARRVGKIWLIDVTRLQEAA